MEKLILTDADGVLLDWEWAFRVWMTEHGYEFNPAGKTQYLLHHHYKNIDFDSIVKLVKTFNESAAIGFLPACRDSVHYVKRLHEEHGYNFRVITSLSLDKNAQRLREMNLKKIFGDAIESIVFLDTNAPKDRVLEAYKDTGLYWIEDKGENADAGHKLGLRSILVEHGHNLGHTANYPVVKNWREIFEIITNNKE
jgi:FMN phosphatase YigB (HAD superfamily)